MSTFQFTHPGRGATFSGDACRRRYDVSIHAPREGCDILRLLHKGVVWEVSIHAPREGCDSTLAVTYSSLGRFNSRTPGGVRHTLLRMTCFFVLFQFTHPGRGATDTHPSHSRSTKFQFTHPGRGATVKLFCSRIRSKAVSIHAPREGCDFAKSAYLVPGTKFQFTHPGRGATSTNVGRVAIIVGFNSRTPGGVRRLSGSSSSRVIGLFQFTHPGRGATIEVRESGNDAHVSIHAPREGCDSVEQSCVLWGG